MSWVIFGLVFLTVISFLIIFYFWHSRRLDSEEKKLIKFLKSNGGEVNPRWIKDDLNVSREWLEVVSSRLEEKGKIIRWGWRAKSLICLKGSISRDQGRVVNLLKENGGEMKEASVMRELGLKRDSFFWRKVRKMEAKGLVEKRVRGKENYLVLVGGVGKILATNNTNLHESKEKVKFSKREKRLVLILEKGGGEMRDVSLEVRMEGSGKVVESLVKKGVLFRWGAKRKNVCLFGMLSKSEERLVGILEGNDGVMMWRDLVREMGYCGKGFCRVLDKLERKGFIMRRKVGRSVEVVFLY